MTIETWIDSNAILFVISLITIGIWDLVWKLKAMWRAGQRESKVWFVCLMIFNTIGILPIIYLVLNKKDKK